MQQLNHVCDSRYELVELVVINDQWGRNFEHHEIVPTDLSEDAVIPEKAHAQHLSEHARVDFQKCLERYAQAQFLGSGEFNAAYQADAANILDHFVRCKDLAQTEAEIITGSRGALTQ